MVTTEVGETAAQRLKWDTAEMHFELEAVVQPRLESLKSVEDYYGLLKKFYGFFKPVELLIEQQISPTVLADIMQRRKADVILSDLAFTHPTSTSLPLASSLPLIENRQQAFGALYVLEGSTLGGRGITKMLLRNEDLQLKSEQLQFFAGYGAETAAMWTSFIKTLNTIGEADAATAQMCATANQTFILFKNWLLHDD